MTENIPSTVVSVILLHYLLSCNKNKI